LKFWIANWKTKDSASNEFIPRHQSALNIFLNRSLIR
jgi:hypothetical protein